MTLLVLQLHNIVCGSTNQHQIGWKPWTGDGPNIVDIANSECNPWRVDAPNKNARPENLPWAPQITAPMPLEAVYSLMKEQEEDPNEKNILDGNNFRVNRSPVVVRKEYFQSNKNGIDQSKVTDDVLGFCSLVLSYAKAAKTKLAPNESPKLFTTFMPRTEFNTIYNQVKPKFKGDLFTLFESLACYRTVGEDRVESVTTSLLLAHLTATRVDTEYCSGSPEAPESNGKFGALSFTNTASNPPATVNIKDWIQGIGKGDPSPDALSKFDESIDGSIGGLGSKMERIYGHSPLLSVVNGISPTLGVILGSRLVPLFEFRNLDFIMTSGMEDFMGKVDSAIQDLHKTYAVAPTLPDDPAESPSTNPSPAVVAPVDPPSQPSCVPNPTDSVRDSHENQLKKATEKFCHDYAANSIPIGPINIAHTIIANYQLKLGRNPTRVELEYKPDMGKQDDVYDISVTSVDNCTPSGGFNIPTPVADNQCADILYNAWKNCKSLLFLFLCVFLPPNFLRAIC